MCGYVEFYVGATAKIQKSQSKDYEKVLKVCYTMRWSSGHDGIMGLMGVITDGQRTVEGESPFHSEQRGDCQHV